MMADDAPPTIELVAPLSSRLWDESIDCRYRNLYEPLSLGREWALSDLDSPRDRPDVVHRVAMIDGIVVGTGRLDLQPDHESGPSAQLRYCAVNSSARGSGIGRALVLCFEREAASRGLTRVWMDARDPAVAFYARLGYVDVGAGPLKWGIVPHRVMQKRL